MLVLRAWIRQVGARQMNGKRHTTPDSSGGDVILTEKMRNEGEGFTQQVNAAIGRGLA